jgi:hypothetical protein
MSPELVVLHLGALHPVEKLLTLVLAFGPFVVLGAVIAFRRRHEDDADPAEQPGQPGQQTDEPSEVSER